MPSRMSEAIEPPARVLVTGANGFIAAHVIQQLLRAEYHVLGTVRSMAKANLVLKAHGNHPSLSVSVVEDITDAQAYIDAIESSASTDRSISAILHLAAPFSYSLTNFENELLLPAVKGTEAILDIARHFQDRGLRLVVHTNSFACIYNASAGPCPEKTYTSADWSPLTYEDGAKAPNAPRAYRAAKTVAEKKAWAYMKTHAADLRFGLVSLCPAMVFGPFVDGMWPSSPAALNESNKIVWDVVRQGESGIVPPTKAAVWVDVRDVARAHVLALSSEAAVGQRLLLGQVYCNQEIADEAREVCTKYRSRIPMGEPGRRDAARHFRVDASQDANILGLMWTPLRDCLKDLLPQLYRIEGHVE
ncbi:hypothetical protein LTR37_002184 [Vermiconidia calcicola]|uniref:Uncharacterized protein n=1 Tax=Vermiconidia calcicola TaxID=1690605 RepID=A0ACC3NUC7_9PEZI|nr:hypothetical protein LTR37_002184 [Vermiconidia calcicola]